MVMVETTMSFRIRQFQIALLTLALLGGMFFVGAAVVAQTALPDRTLERQARRLEEKIDELEKAQSALRLDAEKRWAVVETELRIIKWLGALIGGSSFTLLITRLADVLKQRAAQLKEQQS